MSFMGLLWSLLRESMLLRSWVTFKWDRARVRISFPRSRDALCFNKSILTKAYSIQIHFVQVVSKTKPVLFINLSRLINGTSSISTVRIIPTTFMQRNDPRYLDLGLSTQQQVQFFSFGKSK